MSWGPTTPSTLREEVTGESHRNQDSNLLFPVPRASISLGAGGTPVMAQWQSGPLASPLGFRAQGACRWGVRQPPAPSAPGDRLPRPQVPTTLLWAPQGGSAVRGAQRRWDEIEWPLWPSTGRGEIRPGTQDPLASTLMPGQREGAWGLGGQGRCSDTGHIQGPVESGTGRVGPG